MESLSGGRAVIDINETIKQHASITNNLISAHALTGCDTVSAFSGIGKGTVLKHLTKFKDILDLGNTASSIDEVVSSAETFVASLYGRKQGERWNSMRSAIFSRKMLGKQHVTPKLRSLPPTQAVFRLHCARAHFQTAIWRSAHLPDPPSMDPLEYGWEVVGDTLKSRMSPTENPIAPPDILRLVTCSCTTACRTTQCSCSKAGLSCTEFCKCKRDISCRNPATIAKSPEDTESEDDNFEIESLDSD